MSHHRNLRPADTRTDINISPMIDMVFILLIFFIVTTVFVDEIGIVVDKPTSTTNPTPDQKDEPVVFRIMANGQILHKDREVTASQIENIVREALSRSPDLPVILNVQRSAHAGQMVQAIDRARSGKARKVSVTTIN